MAICKFDKSVTYGRKNHPILETRVSLLFSHQTLLPDDSLKLLAFYNHKANSIGFFARRKVASNKCLTSIFSQTIMKKGCY